MHCHRNRTPRTVDTTSSKGQTSIAPHSRPGSSKPRSISTLHGVVFDIWLPGATERVLAYAAASTAASDFSKARISCAGRAALNR